jgi:hypothetical protein
MSVSASQSPRLSGKEKAALVVCFVVIVLLVIGYWESPPTASKTTTKKDASGAVVSTTVEAQTKVGDAVLLGGLGFAALLGLTAMTSGRFKVTAPGGGAIEVASVAATAQGTIDSLMQEVERLATELAATKGQTIEAPEARQAVSQWESLKSTGGSASGSDWGASGWGS